MKKYNFRSGAPNLPRGSENPPERLSPQAKRLAIIGVVAIVLGGAVYLYTTYFRQVPAPSPPPRTVREPVPVRTPSKPIPPPQVEVREQELTPRGPMEETLRAERGIGEGEGRPPDGPKQTETVARAEKPPPPTRVEQPSPKLQARAPARAGGTQVFVVQVASLVVKQNALNLEKRLGELGYTPVIDETTAPISRHRVYVGEFSSREEAEQVARRLNVDGFPSNLVEGEDGMFRPEVGSSYNLNKVIDLARTLQQKKYSPKIVSTGVPTSVYQVRVGGFDSRAQAVTAVEALKKQGFTPIIVRK